MDTPVTAPNTAPRLAGRVPKIGIRPVIDGRRKGVRESLENQVMAMARAAADLFEREQHLLHIARGGAAKQFYHEVSPSLLRHSGARPKVANPESSDTE